MNVAQIADMKFTIRSTNYSQKSNLVNPMLFSKLLQVIKITGTYMNWDNHHISSSPVSVSEIQPYIYIRINVYMTIIIPGSSRAYSALGL